MNVFRFIPGYESGVYEEGKEPLLFLFLSFLVACALTRLYTRLARSHNWGSGSVGGVHMHHMVPGVILMVASAIMAFSQFRENNVVVELAAVGFGIGAALTLDEFALMFHLKDVYWTREGQTSVDAMIMGLAASGLLLASSSQFEGERSIALFTTIAVSAVLAAITFLKNKPILGVVAIFVSPMGIVGALRLAKPNSAWAHWFYDPRRGSRRRTQKRQRKLQRSTQRFEQGQLGRFERWFSHLIGGKPHLPSPRG